MPDSIIFLILRRMRRPLLTLIVVYAVAMTGLALIPGEDAAGNPWHMSLFDAFYVVSYTSTTIGFGELPHPFTAAQRLWMTLWLYITVIAWLYAIGTILSLLQDKSFQQAITQARFAHQVRSQREPFYLVCGYGETGAALVRALTDRGLKAVVLDDREERTNLIQLQNLREYVPRLRADARRPDHLLAAGLRHPQCAGVVALTHDNAANLKVAITAKLLHPEIPVICRADSHDVEANMASFGTDHIIDPFDAFAEHLTMALQAPCRHLLERWLSGSEDRTLAEPVYPPRDGHWVICGYGRFGKAIHRRLKQENIRTVIIEAKPEQTGEPPGRYVRGRGTEADTLLAARIDQAVGVVAGTDDDANNLSIIMTARDLNRSLFVIARQNHVENAAIVSAVGADMVMQPSQIIADRIRRLLITPMLHDFLAIAANRSDAWACQLISRISAMEPQTAPAALEVQINTQHAPALHHLLQRGDDITLGDLIRDPWHTERHLDIIPLYLERAHERTLLPPDDLALQAGDRLLFCGARGAFTRMQWSLWHLTSLGHEARHSSHWVARFKRPPQRGA